MDNMLRAFIILFFLLISPFIEAQYFSKYCDRGGDNNFVITNPTVKDQLASNSIRKITKIKEGYIFLASYNGISLYDGETFINFNAENTKGLRSNTIYDFCYAQDSSIWLATQKGISVFDNLQIRYIENLKELNNYSVQKVICDREGNIWIGTQSKGLYIYKGNKLKKIKELSGLEKNIMSVLYADSLGRIWVGTEIGDLYYFDTDKQVINTVIIPKIANGVFSALYSSKGKYYFGTRNGLYTFENDTFKLLNDDVNFINDIVEDNYGAIWLATNSGLYCYDTVNNNFIKQHHVNKQIIQSVYFDNDNIIWISTYRKGFIEVRPSAFVNYPLRTYGINEVPSVVALLKNGAMYVGTDEGNVYNIRTDTLLKVPLKTSLKGSRIKDIYQDKDGSLWICSYGGLLHIDNGKETLYGGNKDLPDMTIRYIVQDDEGNYYVATRQTGVYKLSKEHKVIERFNTSNGLSSNYVLSLKFQNRTLYVSTKGGIDIIKNNKIIKQYRDKTGLADNLVFDLYIDGNVIWAATIRGLSRIQNDKIINFSKSNGLKLSKIFSVIEDNYGYLWLPTVKGLMRVEKKQLNDYVKNPTGEIRCALYDENDGIYDAEYVGATHLEKSLEGDIYFNTIGGISKLIPRILVNQHSTPKLLINKIFTEKDTFIISQNVVLKPGTQYVNIAYSYIDFVNSKKARFRHKLIPFEDNWVDNTEKIIKYTNLPPGDYTFVLEAIPEIGKSKTSIAKLNFSIAPSFYQTKWFKLLIVFLFLSGVYTIYFIRMRTVKIYQQKLEDEIQERTKEITRKTKEIAKQNEEILLHQYQLEQAYINLKLLSELGREITTHLKPDEINVTVYNNLSGIMELSIFGIGIYRPDKDTIVFDSWFFKGAFKSKISIPVNNDNYLISKAFKNSEDIIIYDAQKELSPDIIIFPNSNMLQAVSSIIILPITTKNKTIGVVTAQSYRKNAYSDYQVNMLKGLSAYFGVAIENAKIYEEINKRKNELQHVNQAKDKMLSIIGHDLRGPVGTIKSFLDLLLENPEMTNTKQLRVILRTMQESLGSAYNLLDNLLLWARSQSGKIDFKQELFPISQPVDESFSLVAGMAKNKNIKLVKKLSYYGKVYADKVMITTVLRNLISNAIKFTPHEGQIIVSAKLVEAEEKNGTLLAEISVSDTGVGISDEIIKRILKGGDIFSTLGTDKEKGSGLGINICIDFLNKHNQKMIIENNETGGSTFKFFLPVNK
ncbi:MAG: ATP-binding protein [Bacteroidales bacterium]|nr:ATP-binding protein [Bacteroidales bacterium]